jgi:DNA-binding protein H-NS
MSEYKELSEDELQVIIGNAEAALKAKKVEKHKGVINQIKELATSIGVTVTISESKNKVVKKVDPKYRNPDNEFQTWTGRGVPPRWMQALNKAGHDKSEFTI